MPIDESKHPNSPLAKKIIGCAMTVMLIPIFLGANIVLAQSTQSSTLPTPDHIVIVIMENHSVTAINDSSAAPYINALQSGAHSASFNASFAIEHPSQPNYLDLFSGSNQGVTDDAIPSGLPFTTDNLARELIDVGKTFITYSEDLPSVGFNGGSSGNYARKHNPAANWMGTGTHQIPTNTNQRFSAFPTDFATLPTVCFVVPNQNNDMHNGSDPSTITTGDTWIKTHLDGYIQWAKTHNSLFILTFDEDDNTTTNRILTIFNGESVQQGFYNELVTHFTILRTIEAIYQVRYAGEAANATPITDVWTAAKGISAKLASPGANVSVFPNPTSSIAKIRVNLGKAGSMEVTIINSLGMEVARIFSGNSQAGKHSYAWNTTGLPSGSYACLIREAELIRRVPVLVIR
jgi:hypothetical protein